MPAHRTQPSIKRLRIRKTAYEKQMEAMAMALGIIPRVEYDLMDMLRRLADATDNETRVAVADELKAYVNRTPQGGDELVEDLDREMDKLVRPFIQPAMASIRKRRRFAQTVLDAWDFIGRAAIALLELNRPQKFGDGKRAYLILGPYVHKCVVLFLDFSRDEPEPMRALHKFDRGEHAQIDFAALVKTLNEQYDDPCQVLSEEDKGQIVDEELDAWDAFVDRISEPFAEAVRRCRAEQKRNSKMADVAGRREYSLFRCCAALAGVGYGEADEQGRRYGLEMFEDARRELQDWAKSHGHSY